MTHSTRGAVAVAAAVLLLPLPAASQRPSHSSASPDLPPISYVCAMAGDEDVIEDKPGRCPKCGMALNPIRLDTTWTCPVHAAVHQDEPGRCPIDSRDLIQVTMSVNWTCRGTDIKALEPRTCPDGSPMIKQYLPRRHGNHNPQHGGQFFMAPDNWHHLEGTYPTAGVFRIYLYDDYTKPLARDLVRAAIAHVVVQGRSFPLLASHNGGYLEAKFGAAPLPATMQAAVGFTSDGREHVFDFRFDAYSKDPATTLTKIAPAPANNVRPTPPIPTSAPSPSLPLNPPPSAVIPVPGTPSDDGTASDVVAQLRARTAQIRSLIDNGRFGEIYVPAFEAKDLAIALEAHESELSPDRRKVFAAALGSIVRAAYLLDAFGDLGNRQQISSAFERFAAAAETIRSMFPQP